MADFYAASQGWQKGLPEPTLRRAADGRLVVAAGGSPVKEPARLVLTDAEWERLRSAPVPPVVEPEPAPEPEPTPTPEPDPEPTPEPEPEPPPVVIGPVADWANPTPRAKRVEGVTNPPFEQDTMYVDCPGLVIPVNAEHFTVIGGNLPTTLKGWRDFWVGGREGELMNAGPRSDGKDLCQVKRWPGAATGIVPDDGVLAFIDYHDVTRPDLDPPAHPDGIQMMAGTNIVYGGSVFRRMGPATQPWFLKTEGVSAGGGPIDNVTLTDCRFEAIEYWYPVHIRAGGGIFPTRITLRNVDLGGKNAVVARSTVDSGLVWENVTNGVLKILETE